MAIHGRGAPLNANMGQDSPVRSLRRVGKEVGEGLDGEGVAERGMCTPPLGAEVGRAWGGTGIITLPSTAALGDGAAQSRRTDCPRNLQTWSQRRAVVLGRPWAPRHANKIPGSLRGGLLAESCCSTPW